MQTSIWTITRTLLSGRSLRYLWAWSYTFVLILGLTIGQSASAAPVIDHHAKSAVEAVEGPTETAKTSLSCHPALSCAAFEIVTQMVSVFNSDHSAVSRMDFVQTQLRYGGPTVNLHPPRLVI